MTSNYRQYKSFVPGYLHDRPRSVIKHCLERKSKSQKYVEDDTRCISDTEGVFEVKGTGKIHTVRFGTNEEEPSCTCKDWLKWKVPCKHFFGIFRFYSSWSWSSLPSSYLTSEYLTSDIEHCSSSATMLSESNKQSSLDTDLGMEDATLMELDNSDDVLDDIPCKKVS